MRASGSLPDTGEYQYMIAASICRLLSTSRHSCGYGMYTDFINGISASPRPNQRRHTPHLSANPAVAGNRSMRYACYISARAPESL